MHRALTLALTFSFVLAPAGCRDGDRRPLNVGLSTTVQDSGLLDVLKAGFEKANGGYRLRVVVGGSGELMELAARGDVDVLISHSPKAELEFMAAGHGLLRRAVMENDFVIVGPPDDPARIRGTKSASDALARIAGAGARTSFLSRGDDSGTHRRELELWADAGAGGAGAGVERGRGYRELGQGMGAVLIAASELQAYALTDRATYMTLREGLELEVMLEGDERLRNVYSVIVSRRARDPEGGRVFADWLTSAEGRAIIEDYGIERFGAPLFRPTS